MTRSSLAVILALAAPSAVALDLSELSGKTRPSVVLVRVEDADLQRDGTPPLQKHSPLGSASA